MFTHSKPPLRDFFCHRATGIGSHHAGNGSGATGSLGAGRQRQRGMISYILILTMLLTAVGIYFGQSFLDPKESRLVYSASLRQEVQAMFQSNESLYARAMGQQGVLSYAGIDPAKLAALATSGFGRYALSATSFAGGTTAQLPTFGTGVRGDGSWATAFAIGPLKASICQTAPIPFTRNSGANFMNSFTTYGGVTLPDTQLGCVLDGGNVYAVWFLGRTHAPA